MEAKSRELLSKALRLADILGLNESVANHFSTRVEDERESYLINPKWKRWRGMTGDMVIKVKAGEADDRVDSTAYSIHGACYKALPEANCILHVHSPNAVALSTLLDPTMIPIDQNTARFFNRVAYDPIYNSLVNAWEEGVRTAGCIKDKKHQVLVMSNHGVLVTGSSIQDAFERLYYWEIACRTLITAYSTGRDLRVLSDKVAEETARAWEDCIGWPETFFNEMLKKHDLYED